MAIRTEDHSDMRKFCNRLWAMMEKKNYKSPRELATVLFDLRLVEVNSKPGKYTRQEDIRKNAIGSVEKKIVRHLRLDTAKDVQGEFILAYCKHLECSPDFLYGYTEISSADVEVRRICEKTGLSEKAVTRLIDDLQYDLKRYTHNCWSTLIESELYTGLALDYGALLEQYEDALHFSACAKAIEDAIKKVPPTSMGYNIEAAKISTMEKGYREHYSAYYGMVHKIAQDVAEQIIKLSERKCDEDKIFQKEYENALYESKRIIAGFNGEPLPERKVQSEETNDNDEEGFKFHKHYII